MPGSPVPSPAATGAPEELPPATAASVPGADYPGRELMLLLRSFTTETDRYVDALGHLYGMHRTDLDALSAVLEAGREGRQMTPGLLGATLSLSSAATTALVDRLSRAGYMVRARSGTDRRQVQLEATDSARARGAEIFAPMVKELLDVIARRSPEETALLSAFIGELRDAMVRARKKALEEHRGVNPE